MSHYLRLNIDDTQTTIDILDTSNFPVDGGVVTIESETIQYLRATSQGITGCARGFIGTTPATHLAGTPVVLLSTPIGTAGPVELNNPGSPTDHVTGVGIAPTGSRYTNTTNGGVYINISDANDPEWSLLSTSDTGAVWGNITGDIEDQTDLQDALDDAGSPPGGSTGDVQLNAGDGTFGGGSDFNYDGATLLLNGSGAELVIASDDPLVDFQKADKTEVAWIDAPEGSPMTMHSKHEAISLEAPEGGLLIPQLTTTARDAISSPAESTMIYNTTDQEFQMYDGASWVAFGGGSPLTPMTPAFFAQFAGFSYTTSSTFSNTNMTGSFAVSDASHRVKVTVMADAARNQAVGTLQAQLDVDGVGTGSIFTLLGDENDVAQGYGCSGPVTLTWVFSPGDTASHVYTAQYASQDNTSQVIYPYTRGMLLIEEIDGAVSGSGGGELFTPQSQNEQTGVAAVTSDTYFTNAENSFTMATASHRVKVSVWTDGYLADPLNAMNARLIFDEGEGGEAVSPHLRVYGTAGGTDSVNCSVTMSWIFTPGDAGAHTYGFQVASGDNTTAVVCPNVSLVMHIEEIV